MIKIIFNEKKCSWNIVHVLYFITFFINFEPSVQCCVSDQVYYDYFTSNQSLFFPGCLLSIK